MTTRKGGAVTRDLSKLASDLKAGKAIKATRLKRIVLPGGGETYLVKPVELRARKPKGRRLAGRAELRGGGKEGIVRDSHKESRRMGKKATRLTKKEARSKGEPGAFAAHLGALMDERGWDHHKLAEKLQEAGLTIAESGIRVWMRGEGMPKAEQLRAIGRVFGLDDPRHILPPGK